MPRVGVATVPLDYGKCPHWLFERMKRLSRGIVLAIVEEFGPEEFLRRISDPIWFQSLGCVIGFDWNSSGLTTTTMGALKEGLRGLGSELGIFVCGGKGGTSRKAPQQIQEWGEFLGWPTEKVDKLVYASKISAKVDNNALQDNFQLYHHNLIFIKSGQWAVIQQGMNEKISKARRYHWLSSAVKNYIQEPHSGIISEVKVRPLNLVAKESNENRKVCVAQVREEPKTFLKNLKLIQSKTENCSKEGEGLQKKQLSLQEFNTGFVQSGLIKRKKLGSFTSIELYNKEFRWHPVVNEKFDLKRLEKTIFFAHQQNPQNFEQLLAIKGVGPKTIRALSLVSELIYGAKPSYEDPARYSFAHGGKDHTPFPVDRLTYDQTLEIMEKGIKKAKVSNQEKIEAQRRLTKAYV